MTDGVIEEANALRSRMQHAGMADAARCSDCCTALCRRGEQFRYSLPRNSSPASINSDIRSHQFGFPLPRIFSFLSMESVSRFHEFTFSLSRILTLFSTNVGIQKRHPFVGDVFLYRFSFMWRCLADSNRRRRFCRPLTKPLIQGTISLFAVAKVQQIIGPAKFYRCFFYAFCRLLCVLPLYSCRRRPSADSRSSRRVTFSPSGTHA